MTDAATRNRRAAVVLMQSILLIFLGISHYSGIISLRISNAVPMTAIPFLIAVSIYSGMWRGVLFGLIYGIFADAVVPGTVCFNTVTMTLLTLTAGILITYIFNRNISAAMLLGIFAATFYFVMRWLFLFVFRGVPGSTEYLFSYALPSALYTAVFIVPFYYIGQWLQRRAER